VIGSGFVMAFQMLSASTARYLVLQSSSCMTFVVNLSFEL
jgi:hypothetical protein